MMKRVLLIYPTVPFFLSTLVDRLKKFPLTINLFTFFNHDKKYCFIDFIYLSPVIQSFNDA